MTNLQRRTILAGNIRAELARSQASQTELAEVIGMSRSSLSRRLRGLLDFSAPELIDAAEYFHVSLDRLAGTRTEQGELEEFRDSYSDAERLWRE